jgi:hypothetical protein
MGTDVTLMQSWGCGYREGGFGRRLRAFGFKGIRRPEVHLQRTKKRMDGDK